MDQLLTAARAEQMERSLLALAAEIDEIEAEVASAANVQWESPAADAFRHGLIAAIADLPPAVRHLHAAVGELRAIPLICAAGS
ncbi:hypothetical protein [Arthrobacter sp. YD2]|uniref:hypothetical protein n=1 Tax=Arthrobacter sp. YD2 TaxID=3058046 RepID=UPI0025B45DA8|nr:hypothetical protein [Arthrobacter sp. YD2]MDN3903208.1 hypothetical protein [Arthrobacter sp. YD2]